MHLVPFWHCNSFHPKPLAFQHGLIYCAALGLYDMTLHGAAVQFVDHPADFCFRLPDHLSHEEGAMVEPLSVGVHAVRRAGVSPGKTVAIMGAGPIGEPFCPHMPSPSSWLAIESHSIMFVPQSGEWAGLNHPEPCWHALQDKISDEVRSVLESNTALQIPAVSSNATHVRSCRVDVRLRFKFRCRIVI